MAYVIGAANTLADLRTAIINACVDNGWTNAGDVVYRDGCYARLQVVSGSLRLLGGTGIDGSNNLTGSGPTVCRIADFGSPAQLAFPMTYFIHVNSAPDEVYVLVNYSTGYYQRLAFGRSAISLPGSGNWYEGSVGEAAIYAGSVSISQLGGGSNFGQGQPSGGFFWISSGLPTSFAGFVHHGLEGGSGWSGGSGPTAVANGTASAVQAVTKLVEISPNTGNLESVLLPIPVVVARPSSLYSLVLQPRHARYVRLDNYSPGQSITLGTDVWVVYPFLQKNPAARNGGSNVLHTGTFGLAVRRVP